jgi:hypothetical protein
MVFIPNPMFEHSIRIVAAEDTMAVANEILANAQDLCPQDTGDLLDSLHAEPGELGVAYVIVGTDHWIFPEFGSWNYPPEPYMRPALDMVRI